MNFSQVIIVGAGIAGLAAAKTLLDNGLQNIKILEAQDYPGGRIRSVPLNGSWVETGAQWIHGQNNEMWSLAHKYDLLSPVTSSEGEGFYIRDDGVILDSALVDEVHQVVTKILQECEQYTKDSCNIEEVPSSIGRHLREKFEQYLDNYPDDSEERRRMKEELYDWHLRFQVIDNSCVILDTLSARSWGKYSFCGGEDYVNFKEGYSSLVKTIIDELPSGILYLNSPVQKVKWHQKVHTQIRNGLDTMHNVTCKKLNDFHLTNDFHNPGSDGNSDFQSDIHHLENNIEAEDFKSVRNVPVVVVCNDGVTYAADHVIVTSSLGCLKENYKTMFEPQLPHFMAQAIEDMGFSTINKILLVFKNPWWTSDTKGFQLIWSKNNKTKPSRKEPSSWTRDLTGFDVILGQAGVLLGWVGAKGAELMEELSDEEVGLHCTELLRKFTQNGDIPLPYRVIRSQWHKNPYIRGGYSNSTNLCDISNTGPSNLATPLWADVYCEKTQTQRKSPVVLLAGEATHEHYFSTTHGAYETGQNQAKIILNYLNL